MPETPYNNYELIEVIAENKVRISTYIHLFNLENKIEPKTPHLQYHSRRWERNKNHQAKLSATSLRISSVDLRALAGSLETDCQTSPCLGSVIMHLDTTSVRFSCTIVVRCRDLIRSGKGVNIPLYHVATGTYNTMPIRHQSRCWKQSLSQTMSSLSPTDALPRRCVRR